MDIQFNDLTKDQLWQLRNEIILGSLFTAHYRNSFHFAPRPVQDFFDGYVDYLQELAEESGYIESSAWTALDTPEHLYDWFLLTDDYSWMYGEKPDT